MTDIEIIDAHRPRRIGEFWFKNPNKPVGIWELPNVNGYWSIGVEFIESLEDYPNASQTLQNFIDSKSSILQGLIMNTMTQYSSKMREMIFLHEDAMFDIFLLQYSTKPNAKEYQNGAREKFNELRKTGIAFRGDVEEKLQDPYEQRKIMLQLLLTINEEQRGLQSKVQSLEEKHIELTEKLTEEYISLDNRDLLIAMIHEIHLNTGISHGVIYNDIYKRFHIPRPKSNLARINFILNKDFLAIKEYLETKYKLLPFFMGESRDKTEIEP